VCWPQARKILQFIPHFLIKQTTATVRHISDFRYDSALFVDTLVHIAPIIQVQLIAHLVYGFTSYFIDNTELFVKATVQKLEDYAAMRSKLPKKINKLINT
jgi:hypothetical protein